LLNLVGPAYAETDPKAQELRDVGSELRCPTCTGLSVMDSDAGFSLQIRQEVKNQLDAGKSKDEILKFFVERYGPWILRKPPVEGINAIVWLLPIGALILGPLLIWFLYWRRRDVTRSEDVVRSREDIIAEMQRALENLKSQRIKS
jgi:cytochrome c-type biogenesis protein CcmH/NrfF